MILFKLHYFTALSSAFLITITVNAQKKDTSRMIAPEVLQNWPSVSVFSKDKHIDVNNLPIRTNIKKAIELGVHNLNTQFDRDKGNEPYFYCQRRIDGTGQMLHAVEIGIPHVVGRSMLGSEIAEWKAGIPFPKEGFDIYEKYCKQSFNNPDHLNSFYKDTVRGVEMHNMREGLWSLWALIIGRNSSWARNEAHQMLVTLDKITDKSGRWNNELAKAHISTGVGGISTDNEARMVDPLMAYYEATGDKLGLKLAAAYAKAGIEDMYTSEGKFQPFGKSSGHIHSITSALSGITRYAIFIKDKQMIDKCRQIMNVGVPEYFSSWGWGDEVMPDHPANVVSQGEINQTGDVIRTALYLGANGSPEFYELAERYLRSMLLPAQLWMDDLKGFLKQTPNPKDDSEKDVLNRSLGGYGFTLPNARMRNKDYPVETQDITSGGVHALSECWEHRLVQDNTQNKLNLLFDSDNPDFTVKSYLPVKGMIEIAAKGNKALLVRIPHWVDPKTIQLSVNGKNTLARIDNGYVRIEGLYKNGRAILKFDIPCKTEQETVDGSIYKTTWLGNQLIGIEPPGISSPLPF